MDVGIEDIACPSPSASASISRPDCRNPCCRPMLLLFHLSRPSVPAKPPVEVHIPANQCHFNLPALRLTPRPRLVLKQHFAAHHGRLSRSLAPCQAGPSFARQGPTALQHTRGNPGGVCLLDEPVHALCMREIASLTVQRLKDLGATDFRTTERELECTLKHLLGIRLVVVGVLCHNGHQLILGIRRVLAGVLRHSGHWPLLTTRAPARFRSVDQPLLRLTVRIQWRDVTGTFRSTLQ